MLKEKKCHKIKVWPSYFDSILSGDKTFEVRKDDRNYQVGDSLMLYEWSPETNDYTGLFAKFNIIYKLNGGEFGIEKGYCCLGIEPIDANGILLYCRCGGELKEYLTSFICRKCHTSYPISKGTLE